MFDYKWITSDSPSVFGEFKTFAEDFIVQEVPAYSFSGEGQHLMLHIEKSKLTTIETARILCKALEIDLNQASWAGLKDAFAITSQWMSFDSADVSKLQSFHHPQIKIVETAHHNRKIRTGHLRGNHFRLRIRNVQKSSVATLEHVLSVIEQTGFPNYFGKQRFGRDGQNVLHAKNWILGKNPAPRKRFERKLWVSSVQSFLFNQYLKKRIEQQAFSTPIIGDWMKKEDTGGLFLSEALLEDEQRMKAWEISPTGPIFGSKMNEPTEQAKHLEDQILQDAHLQMQHFEKLGKLAFGTRRIIRIRPQNIHLTFEENCLDLSFFLPKGAYATVLLGELFKDGLVAAQHGSRFLLNESD